MEFDIKYYIQQHEVGTVLNPPVGKYFTTEERSFIRSELQQAGFNVKNEGYGFAVSRKDLHQLKAITDEIERVIPVRKTPLQLESRKRAFNISSQTASSVVSTIEEKCSYHQFIAAFFKSPMNKINTEGMVKFLKGDIEKFSGHLNRLQIEALVQAGCKDSFIYGQRTIEMVNYNKFRELYLRNLH